MDRSCIIFTTVLIYLPYLFFSSSATHNMTESDRLALLEIKSQIDDGPSHVLSSWNHSSLNFCHWKGVTCSLRHRMRVAQLNLSALGLVGFLSPYIGNLTFLRVLDLYTNNFHHQIPPQIGRLHRLRSLDLGYNSFVGEIPINISQCTNLRSLQLFGNQLVGKIPFELASLKNLLMFIIHKNNLTGTVPLFIANLSSLQYLELGDNKFEGGIPNSLGKLESLKWMGLSVNMLSGKVPPLIYNISSLENFVLSSNHMTGNLPKKITLPNLQRFYVGDNNFSGHIPLSLFNTSKLREMDLGHNKFIGEVPLEVGKQMGLEYISVEQNSFGSGVVDGLKFLTTLINCSDLKVIAIDYNQFKGVLPNSITNLSTQLSTLYLGGNQLHGSIPSGLQNYVNLTRLCMKENFFTGSIPFSLGRLGSLQVLSLSFNELVGRVPYSLGNLSRLDCLDLENNMFKGNIISSVTKCQSLTELYLSNNKFYGTISEEVANLSRIRFLALANNQLIGSLPAQWDNFKALQVLDISENKLSGEIPKSIGGCWGLQKLYMQGNFLRGSIPTSLKLLKDIRILDFSRNYLSGEIPKDLGYLTTLQHLNLSFNKLGGRLPTEGLFKNASTFLVDGNDHLCGGIAELHLPTCPIHRSNKGNMFIASHVSIGIGIFLTVATIFIVGFLFLKKMSKEKPSLEPITGPNLKRVSYNELHQATNGFSLANLIGVGTFGSVYKGVIREDEEVIAIKVINLTEQGAYKSFITECNALRKIRHRNLVQILTVCSSVDFQGNDFKALVFKFMQSGSLENWLHPSSDGRYQIRALSLLERLNIAIDIASALDYMHNCFDAPIVHCDLKPSNILLDEDMTAHVGDFGLAKFLSRITSNFMDSESKSSFARGTIGYIPPEYGIGEEVSTQGDVYSFGISLLEMLTRKRPTNDLFQDGLTLHGLLSTAYPLRVMDIVDQKLISEEPNSVVDASSIRDVDERMQKCVLGIVQVGVACSVESQHKRLKISDALMELHAIKEVFTGTRMHRETQNIVQ